MLRYILRFAALILLILPLYCSAEPARTQVPKMKAVRFEEWGFQAQVPQTAARQEIAAEGDIKLHEVYIFGDLIYFIKVTQSPADTLASTAIEQELQTFVTATATLGPSNRWEINSKRGDLFKGVSRIIRPEDFNQSEAGFLKKALWGRNGFQSVSMAALKDESGPIVSIGLIGPKSREKEVENIAKFAAFNVSKIGTATITPMTPPAQQPKPVREPKAQPTKKQPAKPPTVAPKKQAVIRKGDIALEGIVCSIDTTSKCMVMLVDQITLPKLQSIKLEPARRKTVFFRNLPAGVKQQIRIRIVGKNTGIGKAMTADVIAVEG